MIYVVVMVAAGAVFKIWGKTRIANLILGVPALIIIFEFLLMMGVWLFLALAFIIFVK